MLERVYLFTFQYGSIQMANEDHKVNKDHNLHSNMVLFKSNIFCQFSGAESFTFQYGSIQIKLSEQLEKLKINLHSNMVLFKLIMVNLM